MGLIPQERDTLFALHFAIPAIEAAYCFLATLLSTCISAGVSQRQDEQSRRWIVPLSAAVLSLLTTEMLILVVDTLALGGHSSTYDTNMYILLSTIIWIALLGNAYEGSSRLPQYPVWGTWLLFATGETILLGLGMHPAASKPTVIARSVLSVLRLITISMMILLLSHRTNQKVIGDQEEQSALLAQPSVYPGEQQSSVYGSIRRLSATYAKQAEQKDIELELEEQVEDRTAFARQFSLEWLATCCSFTKTVGLFKYRHFRWEAFGLVVVLFIERALMILLPWQFGRLVDALVQKVFGHDSSVGLAFGVFILIQFLAYPGLLGQTRDLLAARIASQAEFSMRAIIHAKVLDLSRDFQTEKTATDVLALNERAINLIRTLQNLFMHLGPLTIDIIVAYIVLSCVFGGYMLVALLMTSVLLLWTFRHVQKHTIYRDEFSASVMTLEQWESVMYHDLHAKEKQHLLQAAQDEVSDANHASVRHFGLQTLQNCIVWCLGTVATTIVINQVVQQRHSPGLFAFFIMYIYRLASSAQPIVRTADWDETLADTRMFKTLFSMESSIVDGPHLFNLHRGTVMFQNVSFHYLGGRPLLRNLNFQVDCGQHVAIVGDVGVGKTTLLRLLLRFYDVDEGKVMIDGQDIRDVTMDSFRQFIGIVPQELFLIDDTVMENVRYARLGATDQEVIEACQSALMHEKIQKLAHGYATKIGQNGVKLSSGERQLLAVARVLLQNPPIVVFDEAVSAVDSQTTAELQTVLKTTLAGRTMLTAAHRLSTAKEADMVMFLEDGRVAEYGPPQHLLESNSKVSRFFREQIDCGSKQVEGESVKASHEPPPPNPRHTKDRSSSAASKIFSPNAPEFVPSTHKVSENGSAQLPHSHDVATNRVNHRESSAHSRSHAMRSASSDRIPKRDTRPRSARGLSTHTVHSKQASEHEKQSAGSRYDGPAEPSTQDKSTPGHTIEATTMQADGPVDKDVPKVHPPKLNRWQRRRLARSDPQASQGGSAETQPSTKTSTGSPSRIRQALRHVSSPSHFPSGGLNSQQAESKVQGAEPAELQAPKVRRQRHLRIKKYRDQAAARNKVSSDNLYRDGSQADASTSTLVSVPIIATAGETISEAPE